MSTYIVRMGRGILDSKTLYLTNNLEIAKLKMKEFSKKDNLFQNQGKLNAIVKTESMDELKDKSSLITEGFIQMLATNEMKIQVFHKKTFSGMIRTTTEFTKSKEFYIEKFNPEESPFPSEWDQGFSDFIEINETSQQETKKEIYQVEKQLEKVEKIEKLEETSRIKERTKEENYDCVILELKSKFNEKSKLKKKIN